MYEIENDHQEKLVILTYTLMTGLKLTVPLSMSQLKEFINCFKDGRNFVATVAEETYGLNPQHIAAFHIYGLANGKQQVINPYEQIIKNPDPVPLIEQHEVLATAYAEHSGEIEIFFISCKCGKEYYVRISKDTRKGKCNECHEPVFVDRIKGQVDTDRGLAWVMTNKYFVKREMVTQLRDIMVEKVGEHGG